MYNSIVLIYNITSDEMNVTFIIDITALTYFL